MTDRHLTDSIFGETHHPQSRSARRAAQRRPRRRRGRALFLLLVLGLVVGSVYVAGDALRPVVSSFFEADDYPGPGTGKVQVIVNDGDTGRAIAQTLVKADVIKSANAYLDAAAADPQAAAAIQPGAYTLRKQMKAADAFAMISDPKRRTVPRVTVREGLWAEEVFELLAEATDTPLADYKKAAKDPEALGLPKAAGGKVEGYLFPASYEFPVGASAEEQLKAMVGKTLDELETAGVAPADIKRTMIVASIVEGEVSGDADRGKVARVIENRLAQQGAPNYGLLQMDSTVHYAVQKRGKAGTTDEDRQSPSPYNTYLRKGLPPGPINNPGAASIEAAAKPANGTWLFFVTVNPETGETKFATTMSEHEQNVAEFNQWCRDHPGKC